MTKTTNPTLADLKPATILALSKLLSDKVVDDARDQLEAGDHEVEATVYLRGTLEVEEDSETMQVNRLQPMLLLKLALDKLNKVSVDALIEESLEILKATKEGEESPALVEFKAATAAAYKRLAKATKQRKRGAVKLTDAEIAPVEG